MKHLGAISKISNAVITVSLEGNINCEGCKAKAACGVSDSNSKEIEIVQPLSIQSNKDQNFQLNEQVELVMEEELGLKAVFWAYVFPFVLLISALLVASLFFAEWQAGLTALCILIPYYLLIHYLNPFFKKRFKVSIFKL
jgi:sigma-E factor negative regulatory protein RseC